MIRTLQALRALPCSNKQKDKRKEDECEKKFYEISLCGGLMMIECLKKNVEGES